MLVSDLKKEGNKVIFYNLSGIADVCMVVNSRGKPVARGISLCNNDSTDIYNKSKGKELALERAISAYENKKDDEILHYNSSTLKNKKVRILRKNYILYKSEYLNPEYRSYDNISFLEASIVVSRLKKLEKKLQRRLNGQTKVS